MTPSPYAMTVANLDLLLKVMLALVVATTVMLILHSFSRKSPPLPQPLLHVALDDEEVDPDDALLLLSGSSARVQDRDGMLPLHYALLRYTAKEQQGAKTRLVLALLAEHAMGAATPNRFGALPIHFALASCASSAVIAALVAAHPDSAAVVEAFEAASSPPSSSSTSSSSSSSATVSATFLSEFIAQVSGGREALAGMTTRRVWDLIIQPALAANLLPSRPAVPSSSSALWFATHAWDGDFLDTCDALCAFLADREGTGACVWFDAFGSAPAPFSKNLVVVLGPSWEDGTALRSAACLRAIHACVSSGGTLGVAMLPRESERFWADLAADASRFLRMASQVSLLGADDGQSAGDVSAEEAAAVDEAVKKGLDKWVVAELRTQIARQREAEEVSLWMGVLGRMHLEAGRGSEALGLFRKRLEVICRVRGQDDEATLAGQSNLVGLLFAQGLLDEALPLHVDCLGRQQRVLGSQHPSTLTSQCNLALMLAMLGRAEEAVPHYRVCLEGRRAVLGPLHVDTLQVMDSLGQMLEHDEGVEDEEPGAEAVRLFTECLAGRTAALGASHADTLSVQASLAGLHRNHGRANLALPLLKDLLTKQRRVFGQQHPNTLTTVNNLAGLLDSQECTEAAQILYEECLEGRRATLGDRHHETLQAMNNLACLHRASGRLPQALVLLNECVSIANVDEPNHPHTLRFRDNQAYAELKQGGPSHASAAKGAFSALLGDMERVLGPEHPFTERVRERLREAEAQESS